jgi:hypothetical protein
MTRDNTIEYTIRHGNRVGYVCDNHNSDPIKNNNNQDIDYLLFDCFNKECLGIVEKDDKLYYCTESQYNIDTKPTNDLSIDYVIKRQTPP